MAAYQPVVQVCCTRWRKELRRFRAETEENSRSLTNTEILSHKSSFLKEINGISFLKESAKLNTANQFYTKQFPMAETHCVVQTAHMKVKIFSCADGHYK